MIGNTRSSDRQPRLSTLHHASTRPPEPKYGVVYPSWGHTRRFYTDYEAIQHQKATLSVLQPNDGGADA